LAGGDKYGFRDGEAITSLFKSPTDLAVGNSGRVFISDRHNYRVRLLYQGVVSTYAGNGISAHIDGPVQTARFRGPWGVAVDSKGRVFISEDEDHRIRLIENGQVSTFAGSGILGYGNGLATTAMFFRPQGLSIGQNGELLIADSANHLIRKVFGNQVTTFAGRGAKGNMDGPVQKAELFYPTDVEFGPSGFVYIADRSNSTVRVVHDGKMTTIKGAGQNPVFEPQGLTVSASGIVFVACKDNIIRAIENNRIIHHIAGTGEAGFKDGPALTAKFFSPEGLAVDKDGRIYVADTANHRIRMIYKK